MARGVLLGTLSLLLLMPSATAAQTPVATQHLITGRPHVVAYVVRTFETPAVRFIGPVYIEAHAALADAPDRASGGFHGGVSAVRQNIEDGGGTVREASAPPIGDERIALAGEQPGDDGSQIQMGAFFGATAVWSSRLSPRD
jgi:hypothetical protein